MDFFRAYLGKNFKLPFRAQEAQAEEARDFRPELLGSSDTYIFRHEGREYALAWLTQVSPGRLEICSFVSADAGEHIVSLFRAFKELLEMYMADPRFFRIEATAKRGFSQGERALRLLGFKHEGTLRKVFAKQDYELYSIVEGDDLWPGRQ